MRKSVSVGLVVPGQVDKVVLRLLGQGGSFKASVDNLPLTEYAQDNNALIVTPDMDNGDYMRMFAPVDTLEEDEECHPVAAVVACKKHKRLFLKFY